MTFRVAGGLRQPAWLVAGSLLLVTACVIDPRIAPPPPSPRLPGDPLLRFEATYENQVIAEYEKLFTSNFRFTFSNQSDPELVNTYGNNWGKDDEIESTSHLFNGFTNELGEFQGPASSIALSLDGASFIDDPSRPDSAAFYKYVIVPSVNLNITIAGGEEFRISAPHDFYLVRGDVAVLDPGQDRDSLRWYIRRWNDKSAPLPDSTALPAATTWGRLKDRYR